MFTDEDMNRWIAISWKPLKQILTAYSRILPWPVVRELSNTLRDLFVTHPAASILFSKAFDIPELSEEHVKSYVPTEESIEAMKRAAAAMAVEREPYDVNHVDEEFLVQDITEVSAQRAALTLKWPRPDTSEEAQSALLEYGRAIAATVLAGFVGASQKRPGWPDCGVPLFDLQVAEQTLEDALRTLSEEERHIISMCYLENAITENKLFKLASTEQYQRSLIKLGAELQRMSLPST